MIQLSFDPSQQLLSYTSKPVQQVMYMYVVCTGTPVHLCAHVCVEARDLASSSTTLKVSPKTCFYLNSMNHCLEGKFRLEHFQALFIEPSVINPTLICLLSSSQSENVRHQSFTDAKPPWRSLSGKHDDEKMSPKGDQLVTTAPKYSPSPLPLDCPTPLTHPSLKCTMNSNDMQSPGHSVGRTMES